MIKSVAKALDLLELLAQAQGAQTLSSLAGQSGQNVNTVKGLLNTLMDKGYVRQEGSRGGYRLGERVLYLAEAMGFETTLKQLAYPYLEKLHELSGQEAVYCSVVTGQQYACLEYIDSGHELGIRPGNSFLINGNLHIYAQGKLILAELDEKELSKYLSQNPLIAKTPGSITDPRALQEQLETVAKTGLAIVKDECTVGISSLAAGIRNQTGKLVATIAVAFPSSRLPRDHETNIGIKLVAFANEISKKLS